MIKPFHLLFVCLFSVRMALTDGSTVDQMGMRADVERSSSFHLRNLRTL